MNKNTGLVAIIAILTLLFLGTGWWGMSQKNEKEAFMEKNAALQNTVDELETLKLDLTKEVERLEANYATLAEENEALQTSVENAQSVARQKAREIANLKKKAAAENNSLRAQIEELLKIKSELESRIQDLEAENEALRSENEQLSTDLASSQAENEALARLNKTIQDELKRLTHATFKASGFRVEVEKRKPKATAKSRQARRILVSFDLVNVPEEFRGVRPVYLVITDDKGTPIRVSNPINAQVDVNGQVMDIQAVSSREENIGENQRLSFRHDLENKLRQGYYRVAVYTDVGLLGASSFRLR
ncbi:MAG: hypothetical protein D6714_07735 [Bacteroidetes bacterium]|nr:MAG: hypothetical protein D6714_07735 [Bacteroidota bacterium]